jgi:UDP-glucose 4-epimerase
MMDLVDRAVLVFHLAVAVGVRLIVEQPVRTIELILKPQSWYWNLRARVKPVLLISTSEVYGKFERAKLNQEHGLIGKPINRSELLVRIIANERHASLALVVRSPNPISSELL